MKKMTLPVRLLFYLHKIFLFFFYILLRATVGVYCRLKFRLAWELTEEIRKLRAPYLVLADHVHPMDPFFVGLKLKPVIHWVAADANFRTPFMKFVMTVLAGAVAKTKNRSDMTTLSRLKGLVETRNVIGVYQEGERSWDGVGLPPVAGTDKLIRFLKIPVVYAHLEGGYQDHPRWSWRSNRAQVKIKYEMMIGPEEIGDMGLSEINRRMVRTSSYDDWQYAQKGYAPLEGQRRAEFLELVCFLCPQCGRVGEIRSRGNNFRCSCGLHGRRDVMGRFEWIEADFSRQEGAPEPFPTVREWNLWQERTLVERIKGAGENTLFWEDRGTVHLTRGKRKGRQKSLGVGSARFYRDRIEFDSPRIRLSLPLEEITSFSVFKQYYTEFYYNKQLHRFTFTSRSVSGYKWLLLFRLLLDFRNQEHDK